MAANSAFVELACADGRERNALRPRRSGRLAVGDGRGKTGTLHDVANLVGYCTGKDGHTFVFAFMMDGSAIPTTAQPSQAEYDGRLARYEG